VEKLPKVNNLREAVEEVIKNNQREGYPPNRFRNMTRVHNNELPSVCRSLVISRDALSYLFDALRSYPNLLSIEDFISHYGEQWGLKDVVEEATKRVQLYDEIAKKQRFFI
jgi:hypothetical protein